MPVEALLSEDGLVLTVHVVAKGTETGGVLGLGFGLAAALLTALAGGKGRSPAARLLKACELGVALGAVAGAVMVVAKAARDPSMTEDGVHDRAFRIQNSSSTLKTDLDNKFLLGGVAGAVLVAGAPSALVDDDVAVEEPRASLLDRVIRGFSLGGSLAFAAGGGLRVLEKMLKKQLVMT